MGINGTPNGTMTGTSYSTDGNRSLNNNSAGGNGSNTSNSHYSTRSTRGSLSGNGTSNYYYSNTGGSGSQTTVGNREGSCCGQGNLHFCVDSKLVWNTFLTMLLHAYSL